ncbi:MAG: helix-turn-helix domain-containing protein [Succinivibrio sp.]|nr:helix-turn-helix domain-containing protein [Succinivibrio sp.]
MAKQIDNAAVVKRIRYLMAQHNLSQRKLARYLGVTNGAVSHWMQVGGDTYSNGISLLNITRIANFFRVDEDWIINGGDTPPFTPINIPLPDDPALSKFEKKSKAGTVTGALVAPGASAEPKSASFAPALEAVSSVSSLPTVTVFCYRLDIRRGLVADTLVRPLVLGRKAIEDIQVNPNNLKLFKVTDDCLSPSLMSGDLALVDTSQDQTVQNGNICMAISNGIYNFRKVSISITGQMNFYLSDLNEIEWSLIKGEVKQSDIKIYRVLSVIRRFI